MGQMEESKVIKVVVIHHHVECIYNTLPSICATLWWIYLIKTLFIKNQKPSERKIIQYYYNYLAALTSLESH